MPGMPLRSAYSILAVRRGGLSVSEGLALLKELVILACSLFIAVFFASGESADRKPRMVSKSSSTVSPPATAKPIFSPCSMKNCLKSISLMFNFMGVNLRPSCAKPGHWSVCPPGHHHSWCLVLRNFVSLFRRFGGCDIRSRFRGIALIQRGDGIHCQIDHLAGLHRG